MSEYCVSDCEKCPRLVDNRTQIVNGTGPMDSELLIVGEAPGENEDEGGEPFIGRSGEKLNDALEEANRSRKEVRITNAVRCRPPENKDPKKSEKRNCLTYLHQEISEISPNVIMTVGKIPSETLLNRSVSITKEAGQVEKIVIEGSSYTVVLCPHPAAMFYNRDLEPVFYDSVRKAVSMI